MKRQYIALVALAIALGTRAGVAEVQTVSLSQASQERAAEAVAHYARARALLITALNEFDQARKLARPDELLDPVKWRNTL